MSTIHTAMTGKSDSLIDAVRESEDSIRDKFWMPRYSDAYGNPDPYATGFEGKESAVENWVDKRERINLVKASLNGWLSVHDNVQFEDKQSYEQRKEAYMANWFNELKAKEHYTHPDHPDYMRMVVHQMD